MKLISIFLVVLMSGCAAMTEQGELEKSHVNMPDGSNYLIVRHTDFNWFVPSTQMIRTYHCVEDGCTEIPNAPLVKQPGVGPAIVKGVISTGGFVGGAFITADALRDGLSNSGDNIDVNNSNKNINHNKIKIDPGVKKRRWKH